MDNTAIQEISQLAIEANKANRIDMPTPAIVLASGNDRHQRIESLEYLQATRSRFRGTFSTTSMQDFIAYVVAREGGTGFIDTAHMTATVIFNLLVDESGAPSPAGTISKAGHADNRAVLTLKRSPAFDALCVAVNAPVPMFQKTIVEWLEDWSDCLAADYADSDISSPSDPQRIKQAITALRKVKIKASGEATHTDKDFGASKSALEDIEASSDVGLPRGFRFICQPYDGFDPRTFYLRLGVNADPEKPSFKLRWPHCNRDMESLGQEFKAKLLDGTGDKANLLLGSFDPGK